MIKPILYCGLALTLLSALGFVLMIWSPGAWDGQLIKELEP